MLKGILDVGDVTVRLLWRFVTNCATLPQISLFFSSVGDGDSNFRDVQMADQIWLTGGKDPLVQYSQKDPKDTKEYGRNIYRYRLGN